MASTSGPNDPASRRPDTWVAGAGLRSPEDPHAPGQSYPLTLTGGIDGRAEHLPDGLKAHTTDGGELLTGQCGLPRTARPAARSPGHGTPDNDVQALVLTGPQV